ncbi:MAG: bifunctional oligoribonuclease/PAP phosphatase NrnA [bacterium]|nr:bifunctional oligoribonuclease/PAP phosphatase NrnA [bacterium]
MYKEIYKAIKKYDEIVIARHTGADIDALGSQLAMQEIIKETFPEKKVYAIGAYSSKFKFVGPLDREEDLKLENPLLIVLDTPKTSRIDALDLSKYSFKIKIDHHPLEEKFGDIELVNDKSSSACEVVIDLCNNTKLKMNKIAAERLFMGIVSDTNRFMYPSTSYETMNKAAKLIEEYGVNPPELYEKMYLRDLVELRFEGYMLQNLKLTKNKVAYIKITDEIQKEFKVDAATPSNMIGSLSYINDFIVWVTFSEDKKQNLVRVSIRSRGPVINTIAMQYNGGGHKLASGVRLPDFTLSDALIDDLDKLCKEYLENNV